MAKKKKTKVGNLISKVGNAIKTGVSNALKSGGLAASATKVTPAQSKSQVTAINSYIKSNGPLNQSQQKNIGKLVPSAVVNKSGGSSSNSSSYPGLTGNVPSGITFSPKAVDIGKAFSSGGLKTNSVPKLSSASAPTSADDVLSASRTGSANFSDGGGSQGTSATSYGLGSTAGANAAAAGAATANDLNLEQKKSAEQQAVDQAAEAQKENQSFLQKIFDKQEQAPTREELRQDYEAEFDIKARTAEINSLQKDLDKVMNDVANQEAVAKDRLGTNDFINNQIAQIRRNSEPIINQLSSEIKWKTGLLTEDRALMNEAISDALADSKSRIDNMKWFYNENSQYLDSKYKDALTAKIKMEDRAYDEKQAIAEYARDVVLAYAKEGIKINIKPTDSMEDITAKISQNPFPQKSSGGGGSSSGYDFSSTQLNKGAVNSGLSLNEFASLPGDIQNFFVSSSATTISDSRDAVNLVKSGDLSSGEVVTILQNMGATQEVIGYLTSGIQVQQDTPKQSFWSTLTKSIGSIFD